ncbi:MAG: pyridoxine 5'-phosphate synthase [Crocinitomicaceae bacterium]|nr:pyridoxine 5'-phosphate synthase [Crocinitomicaceae bacterium]|tara:strand:+ start:72716 stop:73432 length:717 start_codon:yes stop_codon:yes gene_type:complete
MSTKLSLNVNKIATLRNSRGQNRPNVVDVALDCEKFGADGITVHPRPDERHIKFQDVYDLSSIIKTELNIEGYPNSKFMSLISDIKPSQVTFVPDEPGVLTSNSGWNTQLHQSMLTELNSELRLHGVRSSIFVDTDLKNIEYAAMCGADRIELYTGPFALNYSRDKEDAVKNYINASKLALELGLGVNAGHDLCLENLKFFASKIEGLLEVSIGHALICDAIYYGLQKTIQMYQELLK